MPLERLIPKIKTERVISGLLAAVRVLPALIQPPSALAEDPKTAAYEAEFPTMETIRPGRTAHGIRTGRRQLCF